jgi:hypothetical protein
VLVTRQAIAQVSDQQTTIDVQKAVQEVMASALAVDPGTSTGSPPTSINVQKAAQEVMATFSPVGTDPSFKQTVMNALASIEDDLASIRDDVSRGAEQAVDSSSPTCLHPPNSSSYSRSSSLGG